MANITLLPSAKVPLIYSDTNGMTTEWYRFFWNIYGFTGTGVIPVDKGGTGLDTIGEHEIIIGNANNVFEPATMRGFGINVTYDPGFVNLSIGASGVTPGTYGTASSVGQFTINQYGVITFAQDVAIGIDANQITSGTLDVVRGGTGQSTYTNGQLLIGNTTGNTLTKATLTAGAGITITNGPGAITISGIGGASITSYTYTATAGQTVFTGLSYTPGNNGLSVFVNGSKQATSVNYVETNTTTVTFVSGLNVGDFVEIDVVAAVSSLSGVTGVTGTAPIVSTGGATPAISIPAATSSVNGYLTSTDWTTFNSKQAALVSGTNIKTVGGVSLLGSGDVGTIGVGYGGTGITSLTAGYIPFGNGTSALASNANFVWDNTNGRLGVGTGTPKGLLDVVGTGSSSTNNWAYISGGNVGAANPAAGFAGGLAIGGNYSNGNSETNLIWGQGVGAGQYFAIGKWTGSTYTEQMRLTSTGTLAVVSKVTAPNLQGPAFSAYKSAGAGNQTITSATFTKITFDAEYFDTNSNFASSAFTPNVAGYYQISACVQPEPSTGATRTILILYKNGSLYSIFQDFSYAAATFNVLKISGSQLVDMNGTTDYLEIYVYVTATTAVIGSGAPNTWFTGSLVRSA